jgi:hypothetical protein
MSIVKLSQELKMMGLDTDIACVAIANERNRLLSLCDWTQMPDAPLTNEERESWRLYRQALRDITSHSEFPFLNDEPISPPTKVWAVERVRSAEVEEEMRIEREALEAQAIAMEQERLALESSGISFIQSETSEQTF